jgi:hypothetical protein
MKCPSGSARASDDAAECPACGLIFAKWRERQEKEKLAAAEALAAMDVPPKPVDSARARIIAGSVVLAWLLVFGLYVFRHTRRRREPLGTPTGNFVEMRDPQSGETKRMPIRRLGVPAGPSTVPAAPAPDASEQ